MNDCFICLQKCVIPIQLRKFKCFSDFEMNCHSTKKICVQCYTQSKIEKCVFCRSLPRENGDICIDFQTIQTDEFSVYTCPFCTNFSGSHFDLYKHLKEKCLIFCPCGEILKREYEKKHYEKECDKKHECKLCNKFVTHCNHSYCYYCKDTSHTEESCKNIKYECSECSESIHKFELVEHILSHINIINNKMTFFKEEYILHKQKYQTLMKTLPDIYKMVYNEDFFDN